MAPALLMLHLMLIAMGTGMSFSNIVNMRVARRLGPDAGQGLALQRRLIARIGDGVIALIWLTGLLLLWIAPVVWSVWLGVKLAVVVLLTLCHALARRTGGTIMRTGDTSLVPRLNALMIAVFCCALTAIGLAVVAFRT